MKLIWASLSLFIAVGYCAVANEELFSSKAAPPWWEETNDVGTGSGECLSSCTDYSRGYRKKVQLCDDTEVCRKSGKKSIDEYAADKCTEWSEHVEGIVGGQGKRIKHEPAKGNWLACAVFCKTTSGSWYTPKQELEQKQGNAFFPDGIWCHRDGSGTDYFCQNNLCLPEKYDFTQLREAKSDEKQQESESSFYYHH